MTHEALSATVSIQEASPKDADEVARFCQPIYQAVYPNGKYGIKPEHLSPWVFQTEDTLNYFRQVMQNNDSQRAYIARLNGEIVGTISITEFDDHYEPRCFYVAIAQQGKGIGKILWEEVMKFCQKAIPIRVEVAETNNKTIAMYEKWGLKRNEDLGVKMRHWPEWPEGLENGYIFLEKYNGESRG